MLLYAERGFVEAAVMRAAGATMEGIVGSGGLITDPATVVRLSLAA
jgi:hypothetical protein